MTADQNNPKVGDVFVRTFGDEATVTAVGRHSVLFVDRDGNEMSASLASVATLWRPKPVPLITEPVTLYRNGPMWMHAYDPYLRRFTETPYITLLPDHTWIEGTP